MGWGRGPWAWGGAYTAVADDVTATYYNPAGLAQIHGHRANVEYLCAVPRVYVQQGDGPHEVLLDKWTKAPMLGIAVDLSRAINLSRQLVVGWAAYFPDNTKSIYKVRYGSFYDPFFPLYGDSSSDQTVALLACAALEVFPWLLVGGGINLQIHGGNVLIDVAVDTRGQSVTEASRTSMDVSTEIYPVAGIMLMPAKGLRIGFAWRESVEFIVGGGMEMRMSLYLGPDRIVPIPVPLNIPAQGHYRPQQFALGASYRVGGNLLLSADATYYEWHPYTDEGARSLNPPMKDVVVPRIGAEVLLLQGLLALRCGYAYQPSPLSPQAVGSPVNLLDNDVHTAALGAGVRWDAFGVLPRSADWSVFYQLQVLVPRTFQNVHAGEPDLRSTGLFNVFGFGVEFNF